MVFTAEWLVCALIGHTFYEMLRTAAQGCMKNKTGRKKSEIKVKRKKNERGKHMRKDSVLAYIKEYAKTQPDTLAVCELRKTVTYEQYFMNIRKMAAVLMSAGIQKDEHVILKCTQNINYLTIFTALQYMGALPIPVEKATMPERMTEIGAQVEAKTLISDAEAEGMRFSLPKSWKSRWQRQSRQIADCQKRRAVL